jgi:hypothetical protein
MRRLKILHRRRWRLILGWRRRAILSQAGRKQHGCHSQHSGCYRSGYQVYPPHVLAYKFSQVPRVRGRGAADSALRIRRDIVLHFHIIQQIEIRIEVVIFFQSL